MISRVVALVTIVFLMPVASWVVGFNSTAVDARAFAALPQAKTPPLPTGPASVLVGKDGWLYYAPEFIIECHHDPRGAVINGVRRLQQILAKSGRQFIFAVAPDKSTAVPNHLPDHNPWPDCRANASRDTFGRLSQSRIPGYIDMRRIIADRQAVEKRTYYLRKATHWNGRAIDALVRRVVGKIDPSLLATATIRESKYTYTADLAQFLGAPAEDTGIRADVQRAGVTVNAVRQPQIGPPGTAGVKSTATTTDAPLYPGNVLVIGDSFAATTLPALEPFVRSLTWIHSAVAYLDEATTAKEVAAANVVVWVVVERFFPIPTAGIIWSKSFLDNLERALPPNKPSAPG